MKKLISLPHLIIGLAMLGAASLAPAMKPTIMFANQHEKIDLEVLIPKQFNDWRVEEMASLLVNPQSEAAINKIYAQTLSRSYVNAKGERIMLSIAYGKDQSDGLGAHLPEGCYGGQGFAVQDRLRGLLKTSFGDIPAARMLATKGERIEPVTYWLTTGEKVAYAGWDTKKLKLQYSLQRIVPDGILMRVSSITSSTITLDIAAAYTLQARFADDLLTILSPSQRMRLMGSP